MMASKELGLRSHHLRNKKSISYVVPIAIIVVLIVAFTAGYYAGVDTSAVTQVQTTTVVTTRTVSPVGQNPICVTLHNCPSAFVYLVYGASLNRGISLNPQNIP